MAAIADEFNILITVHAPGEKLRSSRLNEAFAALQEKVNETRDHGVLIAAPLQTAIAFAGNFAAIRSLCDELNNIRSAMEGLPRFGQALPEAKPHWDFLPSIDWFWVKNGIKGGLASVVALVVIQSFNPPGSTVIPLAAWAFTILSRGFLRAGHRTDGLVRGLHCHRADVAPDESGLASGVVDTSFMMGGALDLAIVTSVAARGRRSEVLASL